MSHFAEFAPIAAEMREAGVPWESKSKDSIQAAFEAKYGTRLSSIIPLRNALNKYLAANGGPVIKKLTAKMVVRLRDAEGVGIDAIAARASTSPAKVRELYAKGGGVHAEVGGRSYKGRDGHVTRINADGARIED